MKRKKRGLPGQSSVEVTGRETVHRALARRAAADGFVLLKNEGGLLPLRKGSRLGLYGAGAVKTVKGGTGSGDVNERDSVSIWQGLRDAGFAVTSGAWLEACGRVYDRARQAWKREVLAKTEECGGDFFAAYSAAPFWIPCGPPVDEAAAAADGADAAVFVLSRVAGENRDRRDEEGDYYITAGERALLSQVCGCYRDVVVVLNAGGPVDLAFAGEFPNIRSILYIVQAGQEGGSALADVLGGDVTPSGRLTDTWALDYGDYPNAASFSLKSGRPGREEYREGIYVGYRYFDTFGVPVRYGFGYGLSYTEFAIRPGGVAVRGVGTDRPEVSVKAEVANTGDTFAGREVVQVYVSCPQGKLPKEFRRLAGFGKTGLLRPGQSQEMEITFSLEQLASYCEERSSWILEAGVYGIWIGPSLSASRLAGSLRLDGEAVLTVCRNICPAEGEPDELRPDPEKSRAREAAWLAQARLLPSAQIRASDLAVRRVVYTDGAPEELPGRAGRIARELSVDQLVALATGDLMKGQGSAVGSAGQSVPGAAAETSAAAEGDPWNVAPLVLADGPAGLRLNREYRVLDGRIVQSGFQESFEGGFFSDTREEEGTVRYQFCTALPVGTLLAQTWDAGLVREVGGMIGREMELFGVSLWLAPGMNIHRNPLCGRNFEYYSEDPLLSGIMASAVTLGVQQSPGCGTTVKHLACNNREDNRMGSDSVLSERTLREIYLKGFEIAVRNAQPMAIMTSYNQINGVHAANCRDLCTSVVRDEWGFAGVIMTDWTTTTASTAGECTAAGCMRAGNDLVMPGHPSDHESIRAGLAAGTLDIRDLRRCVCSTVRVALQSNQYEDAAVYSDQFEGLGTYMRAEQGACRTSNRAPASSSSGVR